MRGYMLSLDQCLMGCMLWKDPFLRLAMVATGSGRRATLTSEPLRRLSLGSGVRHDCQSFASAAL